MAENFFLDNLDLQFHLKNTDLRQVVALKEKGYTYHEKYPAAPRHYEDAQDNYRRLLTGAGRHLRERRRAARGGSGRRGRAIPRRQGAVFRLPRKTRSTRSSKPNCWA